MRRVYITEAQYRELIGEGSSMNVNDDGTLNFSFNNSQEDKDNKFIDTRFFRKAGDLLYTDKDKPSNLNKNITTASKKYNYFLMIKQYIESHMDDPNIAQNISKDLGMYIPMENLSTAIRNLERGDIDSALEYCDKGMRDNDHKLTMGADLKNRADIKYGNMQNGYAKDDKMAQYGKGIVPDTCIPFIALFSMSNFNPSDIIKKGNVRYDNDVTSMLGFDANAQAQLDALTDDERRNFFDRSSAKDFYNVINGKKVKKNYDDLSDKEHQRLSNIITKTFIDRQIPKVDSPDGAGREWSRLPVTYDNNTAPNIRNNFSLPVGYEQNTQHYRDDSNYTSVSQFMDKSILCAAYALKEQNFKPDFIVSAPSSSSFNQYYCTRLSRKLGIPYAKDFFKRNVINIKFSDEMERKLDAKHATPGDKEKIKNTITNAVKGEITSNIKKLIERFVSANRANIRKMPTIGLNPAERDMFLVKSLVFAICNDIMKFKAENSSNVYFGLTKHILNAEMKYSELKNPNANSLIQRFATSVVKYVNLHAYFDLIKEIDKMLVEAEEKLAEGFTVNLKKFKIVDIDARFRTCIDNVYVISDEYLAKKNNGLQQQYQNGNFLIFDEDIDSGGTLKLVIDILQDKIGTDDSRIMCLTNGYKRQYSE